MIAAFWYSDLKDRETETTRLSSKKKGYSLPILRHKKAQENCRKLQKAAKGVVLNSTRQNTKWAATAFIL